MSECDHLLRRRTAAVHFTAMAVRDTLERWLVGAPTPPQEDADDAAPLVRRTEMELARVGDAAEAMRALLVSQEHERSEVLRVLALLPEPLNALPRLAAQQDTFGEMIGQALVQARQRDATMDATLGRIVDGMAQHTEVSGLIQQQLDLNLQAANSVADGTARLTEAVQELARSNRDGTELLSELVRQTRASTELRARSEHTLRGWMIALLSVSAGLILAALVIAWLAIGQRA